MKATKATKAKKSAPKAKTANKYDWFTEARFGMFIHWGLYAIPANNEWIKNHKEISNEDYQKYFDNFNPDMLDAKEWARMAKEAGMKYFVITTKHHEGFCLWDSKYTDYKATKTQAKRDLLKEIVDAFRAEGIKIGFYYSLLDWYHPEFPIDAIHPLRNHPDALEMNKTRDVRKYAKYMRNQITELLTNYGKIDIMWFDFSYPKTEYRGMPGKGRNEWESEKIVALVKKLSPDTIINNRLDLPEFKSIVTPEQFQPEFPPRNADGSIAVWEGCQTFSGSWGYARDEETWKSEKQCIEMLIKHVARGGNLIMNVGPTSRGYFDYRAVERLNDFARWMKYNSRSIYGCTMAPEEFVEPNGTRFTWNPKTKRLYVHITDWPLARLHLPGLAGKISFAQFLHDGTEISYIENAKKSWNNEDLPEGTLTLLLPIKHPNVAIPVVELVIK